MSTHSVAETPDLLIKGTFSVQRKGFLVYVPYPQTISGFLHLKKCAILPRIKTFDWNMLHDSGSTH